LPRVGAHDPRLLHSIIKIIIRIHYYFAPIIDKSLPNIQIQIILFVN